MSISYPCSYLYCSPSSDSELSSESEKQCKVCNVKFFHLHFPLLADFWLTQILILTGCLWAVESLVIQSLGAPCLAYLNFLLRQCFLLQLFLVIVMPILFFLFLIFAEGTIWSPSTFVWLWAGKGLSISFGFFFYRGFWASNTTYILIVIIQITGRE